MKQRILLFDENLSISPKTLSGQLCQLLENKGWTCHSVHDFPDLVGHPDEEIIAFAKKQKWALLTLDKRMAYLAVKDAVDVYLVLHEKRETQKGDVEELTMVQLTPFADVQARKIFQASYTEDTISK